MVVAADTTNSRQDHEGGGSTGAECEFGDRNRELFGRRSDWMARVEVLESGEPRDGAALRRARRAVEQVDTEIVHHNLGLVRGYCRRFTAAAGPHDAADFEAAGLLGLMRAIATFDPDQGSFAHWAFKPIQREVLRAVRDADHPTLNLTDFERRPAIIRSLRSVQSSGGDGRASWAEVARIAGATLGQVRRVLDPPVLESSDLVGALDGGAPTDAVVSRRPGPEEVATASDVLSSLRRVLDRTLDDRERFVLVRRLGLDGLPADHLTSIGAVLGLSREAVRQLEARALAKLQHPIILRAIAS
ncbi:MAG: hypothetical protein RI958_3303 [Actinomycetota bacterium]|jgi:RNA polymerase sigma factor (sigma-70 family)